MNKLKSYELNSDFELVEKICQGEVFLFELLIRRYNPSLYKIGRSYGYNHQDTEDLMQEVFINAYQNLGGFQKRSSFKTWIIRIMLNLCYHQRTQKSYILNDIGSHEIEIAISKPAFSNYSFESDKILISSEMRMIIEQTLQTLPEDYRIIFAMRELSGLNVAETAEALKISESNVKVRLNRAKSMLKERISKIYSHEEIYEFNLVYCDKIVNGVMNIVLNLKCI
ncbi:MAG: sigma-70 family RNA polymerase sigma factor [Cytophagaceae bacterium]